MPSVLSAILRAATREEGDPLNILVAPTHERYETGLCKTGHQFFSFRAPGLKDWNGKFSALPSNYTLLDPEKGEFQLPPDVVFDVLLSQNKLGSPSQFQIMASLARSLNVPHINLEHCLPLPSWGTGGILRLKQMRADVNVFISDYSRSEWLHDETEGLVVEHGIDTDLFSPDDSIIRKPMLLSVVNDWINRDVQCGFHFWREATADLQCFVVGDTPGLSKPAETVDELVWRYRNADIFVNTSLISPVPMALLEAMSCGCAVISTSACMIPEIIMSGYNGILCRTSTEMRQWAEVLLGDHDLCRRLGFAARETILNRFNLGGFAAKWDQILRFAAHRTHETNATNAASLSSAAR